MSTTNNNKSKSDSSKIKYRKNKQYDDLSPSEYFSNINISTPKSVTETESDSSTSNKSMNFSSDILNSEQILRDEKNIEDALYKINKIMNEPGFTFKYDANDKKDKKDIKKDIKKDKILTAEKLISILKENKAVLPASSISHETEKKADISDEVKLIVNKYGKEGDYRFATFVGNVGGVSKRKIMECPNCKEKFLVSRGFNKTPGKVDRRAGARTKGQIAWIDYITELGKTDVGKGKSRGELMKIGSELRKKGITIDQINSKKIKLT